MEAAEPFGPAAPRPGSLAPLFFVSLFAIAFETFLTRWFAVAIDAAYSYWIISIAMLGYSVGGVLLALAADFFYRHRAELLFAIPPLLLVFSGIALYVLSVNPFNPLKLQNEVMWPGQIGWIFLYYAGLFPVFFLTGIFISLNFLVWSRDIARVYAVDLLGAALGAVVILAAMFLVHPYRLPLVVLGLLLAAVAAGVAARRPLLGRPAARALLLIGLAAGAAAAVYVLSIDPLSSRDFKRLHAILSIRGARVVGSAVTPSGYYLVVDDYTEFDDVSMTNNYAYLKIGSPPRSFGLYQDDGRIGALLKNRPVDLSYVRGSLSYFPYTIRRNPRVLLIGTNGGFEIPERAAAVRPGSRALEPQPVPHRLVAEALRRAGIAAVDGARIELRRRSPFALLRGEAGPWDVIEVAYSFLAMDESNQYALTRQGIETYLRALAPRGILSIPVDIAEFSVYALKLVNTIIAALSAAGVDDPGAHVMVYRSEWTCQILVSNRPFTPADIRGLRAYCDERSFDTSWYPGINPAEVAVWNDLPPVPFGQETLGISRAAQGAQDALMQDLVRIFSGERRAFFASHFFNLAPATLDRPDFYSVSRLSKLRPLLARLSLLPQPEIGFLINVIVLAEAVLLGALILFLPLLASRVRLHRPIVPGSKSAAAPAQPGAIPSAEAQAASAQPGAGLPRVVLYFSALGLGFFFVELALIQKFSLLLESSATSFGLVLAAMLVFSGLGSGYAARFRERPYAGLRRALPVVGAGLLFVVFALDPVILAAVGLPFFWKLLLTLAVVAPISFALGRPFPLGITSLGPFPGPLVPWAWAINGAFSVIATPLANIVSVYAGWSLVLAAALLLYGSTLATFPVRRSPAGASAAR